MQTKNNDITGSATRQIPSVSVTTQPIASKAIIINSGDHISTSANTVTIIPCLFADSINEKMYRRIAEPFTMPSHATFPDGTPIHAYRVGATLQITGDIPDEFIRLYALRVQHRLFIFATEDEEATSAAVALTAQVDNGFLMCPEASDMRTFVSLKGETE